MNAYIQVEERVSNSAASERFSWKQNVTLNRISIQHNHH